MNIKDFKTFSGYLVECSCEHHAFVSKEEFDRYYCAMNLFGEASDEQVMTAVLDLPAEPSEDDDQVTNISPKTAFLRIWICDPAEASVSKVANFFTAAKLGILSPKESQYADFNFLKLLLRNSRYVAVELTGGSQIVLTCADLLE